LVSVFVFPLNFPSLEFLRKILPFVLAVDVVAPTQSTPHRIVIDFHTNKIVDELAHFGNYFVARRHSMWRVMDTKTVVIVRTFQVSRLQIKINK
jgi:hypothetical protein